MIIDEKLDAIFDEVASRVRATVQQPRSSILRASRSRIARNANDVDAVLVVAAASLQDREPERSLDFLRSASSVLQDNATGHRLAGYAHFACQQLDSATEHFDHAARLDPCRYDSWHMLGDICETRGKSDKAIGYYQRALVFDDQHHESALALCRLYTAKRDLQEAIGTIRISLLRDRRNPKLNLALARLLERRITLLRRTGKWRTVEKLINQAKECYRIALAAAPSADAYISFGLLQQRTGMAEQSRKAFAKAIELKPKSSIAHTCLANSFVESGEMDSALALYRKSIELEPERAATHFRFTRAQKFKTGPEAQDYLRSIEDQLSCDRPIGERVYLHFAAAKIQDDLGCYDQAWSHYDQANRLKPGHGETQHSSRQTLESKVDETIAAYDADFFASVEGAGSRSEMPMFIIGMPRSGTTLTEQILSSHPDVTGAGELRRIDRIRKQLKTEDRSDREVIGQFAADHLSYLDGLRQPGTSRVIDKMPTNFLNLGLIATLFPNARIVHLRRNPMDVIVSSYCQNLSAPFCDLDALVSYHRQYRRLMDHWQKVLPISIHHVNYESLVNQAEPHSRAMIDHCDLTWHEDCLRFHSNQRTVQTPSKWQVRQPMYSSSVGRWKRFSKPLSAIAESMRDELSGAGEWSRYCQSLS